MRRGAFVIALMMVGASGCVDGDVGLMIDRFDIPTDDCVFAGAGMGGGAAGTVSLTSGLWDTASGAGYVVAPIVQSQLVRLPSAVGADAMSLTLEGLIVELRDIDGSTTLDLGNLTNPYTVRGHATIDSNIDVDSVMRPEAVMPVEMIPAEYAEALANRLVDGGNDIDTYNVFLQAFGSTQGGTSVTSVGAVWPLRVCSGCLVDCNAETATCLPGQDSNTYCPQ